MKEERVELKIPNIERKIAKIKIVGDSPLIMKKFGEKAKNNILNKQTKKAKEGQKTKKPFEDFINSMHWLTPVPDIQDKEEEEIKELFEEALKNGAKFGFPANGLKKASLSGTYRAGYIKNKVAYQGAFHVMGEYIEIKGDISIREDPVTIPATGSADIVYRAQFDNWSSEFNVMFQPNRISLEQVVQMINLGGIECGLGEWRVEKGGSNGMFHVE